MDGSLRPAADDDRRVHVYWDEAETDYDFGPGHPMDPVRLWLTMRLVEAFDLPDADGVRVLAAPPADDTALCTVHEADYLAAVRRVSESPGSHAEERFGLGVGDNPAFPGMHRVSALIAGQSIAAAEAVWSGEVPHAVHIGGGLHHAMSDCASGFCVYNDPALAITRLLDLGAERVAYVDTDVHHGDGVQRAFYHDPRVLTISLHEHPSTLFPRTGWPEECGGPGAEGTAVNVALPPGTEDADWLRALDATVPDLLHAFQPQLLVTQHGADAHQNDPLAHLSLSVDGQRAAAQLLHQLAHTYAEGRWVALGGGGYAVTDVVPRTWTHLIAEAAGRPIPPATALPEVWREQARQCAGGAEPPRTMTDGHSGTFQSFTERGINPADRTDQAVLATRRAVYPTHGLLVT